MQSVEYKKGYMEKPINNSCTVIGLALRQAQVIYYSLLFIHSVTYMTIFIFQQIRNNQIQEKTKKN